MEKCRICGSTDNLAEMDYKNSKVFICEDCRYREL